MRKTANATDASADTKRATVDTVGLQAMLSSGRQTAVEIGTAAGARIQIGRRVLWNVARVEKYLEAISGD